MLINAHKTEIPALDSKAHSKLSLQSTGRDYCDRRLVIGGALLCTSQSALGVR